VLLVGDNELATGVYTLKDMATGSQETVRPDELYQRLETTN
jgi:histidyl-tRNA synthetase